MMMLCHRGHHLRRARPPAMEIEVWRLVHRVWRVGGGFLMLLATSLQVHRWRPVAMPVRVEGALAA